MSAKSESVELNVEDVLTGNVRTVRLQPQATKGMTVFDLKQHLVRLHPLSPVSTLASKHCDDVGLDEQCLIHEGRLIQDHESISSVIEGIDGESKNTKKSVKLQLLCTASSLSHHQQSQAGDSLCNNKHKMSNVVPLFIDPISINVAKAYLLNNASGLHTHTLQTTLESIVSNPNVEFLSLDSNEWPPSFTHTHEENSQQHVENAANMGAGNGVAGEVENVPAIVPPPLLDEEDFPNIIRLQVVFRIAFALMLFGRDYETVVLATVSFFYYFYEVGLWGYLYRRYCPQVAVPPPAVGVPLDVAGGNVMDAEAQPHAVQHNLQHQGWSLGRLLHLLQTPPVLPRGSGPAKDVLALLLAFFCSLFPSWNME